MIFSAMTEIGDFVCAPARDETDEIQLINKKQTRDLFIFTDGGRRYLLVIINTGKGCFLHPNRVHKKEDLL